ncbi:MAG: hypothetical protein CMJ46_05225 [Planctomyces sp.]|nr:hypothetical protein [Planctomyces sp.]
MIFRHDLICTGGLFVGLFATTLCAQDPAPMELRLPNAPPVSLNEVPEESQGITLSQLQELALQHNPTLAQARAETWKANGQYVQAGLKPNPQLQYTGDEIGNEGAGGLHSVALSQEFVTGGKLHLSSQIYAYLQNGASWERMTQVYRVENNVRSEYYNIIVAQRMLELAQQIREISETGLEVAKSRVKQQESPRTDELQAKVLLQNALIMQRNAEAEYEAAWNRMRAVVGWSGLRAQPLVDNGELVSPELEWQETCERLLSMSPVIKQAQAQAASSMAAYNRAVAEPTPNITAQAGAGYDYGSEDAFGRVQISLPIPIHNKNQGNIRTAHAQWVRNCREVERLKLELARNLADEFKKYVANRAQLEIYESQLIPAAEETLDLSQEAFKVGQLNYLQLLTAQRMFTETKIDYLKSQGVLWQSQVAIDGLLLTDGLQAPQQVVSPQISTSSTQ